MNTQHWLLAFFWLMFGALHSFTSAPFFKKYIQQIAGRYFIYYTLAYSLLALTTLLLVISYQFSIASFYLFQRIILTTCVGIAGITIAAFIMAYCIFEYFIPLSGVAVLVDRGHRPVLKTNGLNKYVRHPLYFGTLLMLWSLFLVFPLLSNLVACIAISIYTITGVYFEEQKLIMLFGDEYKDYKRKVPMMIPYSFK